MAQLGVAVLREVGAEKRVTACLGTWNQMGTSVFDEKSGPFAHILTLALQKVSMSANLSLVTAI
ncbi:MAG TPA: hypothetical protein DDZ84_05395 [Firmicutes bacterium]|nr:hypothetical protein [Bacillota bacterium]